MGYVVVVCSRCRLAKGADERQKTTTCPGCGRSLRLEWLKKYHRAETLEEARGAIGRLNAKLKGGLDAYLEDIAGEGPPAGLPQGALTPDLSADHSADRPQTAAARDSLPASKLDKRVLLLLDSKGPLTAEELLAALAKAKLTREKLQKRLDALCEAGHIFEPSVGKYKIVK
jgi:hypothetical protein